MWGVWSAPPSPHPLLRQRRLLNAAFQSGPGCVTQEGETGTQRSFLARRVQVEATLGLIRGKNPKTRGSGAGYISSHASVTATQTQVPYYMLIAD